jgi:hypothetical protein
MVVVELSLEFFTVWIRSGGILGNHMSDGRGLAIAALIVARDAKFDETPTYRETRVSIGNIDDHASDILS